jgi:hypothetical protein
MASDSASLLETAPPAEPKGAARAAPEGPGASGARGRRARRAFLRRQDRAFWVLQSTGWTGYFILRSLSGIANSMGAMFVVHTLLLTATGYSLTLLMGSLYRRLITMRGAADGGAVADRRHPRQLRILVHRNLELRHVPEAQ